MRSLMILLATMSVSPLPAQMLVVVHKDVSSVGLYNAVDGSAMAVLPTGQGPHEVAVSPDGKWAAVTDYGAQSGGQSLTIVDLERGAVAR